MSDVYQQLGIIRWVSNHPQSATSGDLVIIMDASINSADQTEQLFHAMLKAINLTRDDVCLVDIADIHNHSPRMILAMGETVAQTLLNSQASLESLRGKLHSYGEANTPLIATYHPAHLQRHPTDKKKAYADLLLLKEQISK